MTFKLDRITAGVWLAAGGCLLAFSCTGTLGPGDGTEEASGRGSPGGMPLHHVTTPEYNNTVAHLLGTSLRPADSFPAAGATGFDANIGVLSSLSQVLVQGYYDAARKLAADAFANEAQRAEILICDPAASADDTACARDIIESFGLRAWRRPLDAAEGDRLVKRYTEARTTLEMSPVDAVQHVVRILLTSPNFFLRIELGPEAASSPGAYNGYEIASRLSYLLWSSLPDKELFEAAGNDKLSTEDELRQQVDRMLADPKSAAFFENFFGQWFGTRTLRSHNADVSVYPAWNNEVKGAIIEQANAYFAGFTTGDRPWTEFLTASHAKLPLLDPIYADDPEGERGGFLTLPAFLTLSSRSDRTSPTSRAKTILGGVFCQQIAPPANVDIPELNAAGGDSVPIENVRKKLEKHRESPDCASCHNILDPIGLSLENFNAIGGYRSTYVNGDPVDATGDYGGTAFQDVSGIVPELEKDARLVACPPEQLVAYALRRSPTKEDRLVIKELAARWNGGTIKDLVKQVATSEAFRLRPQQGKAQ